MVIKLDNGINTEKNLHEFLELHNLELIDKISKGFSSEIYLVEGREGKYNGRKLALKIEREKSRRNNMVEKEVSNLKLANKYGIGPNLLDWDFERRVVLYKFVEGQTFQKWLNKIPEKKELEEFLKEIFRQAKILDDIGLDHGQLAGRGTNILVTKENKPVIIDFEKASQERKCHNVTTLESFFYYNKNSEFVKKVGVILGLV